MPTIIVNKEEYPDIHPSQTDFFVRAYLEDDGTYDVDVYEQDDRDGELSKTHIETLQEALDYANQVVEKLKPLGSVALNTPE